MSPINIGNAKIGSGNPPFVIAEMSGNHNRSLERALEIVDAAAASGVHALKLQTYTADTMTLELDAGEFHIEDPESLWHGRSLYQLYQEAHTPWEWHEPIFNRCREKGIVCFSTPFDHTAVDFLESLDAPCYKIASFENTDLSLIRKVAATGKPLLISTGMATIAELDEAVRTARQAGCSDIILLKCTSNYPADPTSSNILTIPHMRSLFGYEVGLSDHSLGIGVSVAAAALGATVIEKHFTLNRADGGVDSAFSLEPGEMQMLVEEVLRAWQSLGTVSYGLATGEDKSLKFRRSLYVVADVKKGEILSGENIKAIRPGMGLPVKYLELFLGRKSAKNISRGTPLDWSVLTGD